MVKMNPGSDIDLKVRYAGLSVRGGILTFRYPDGFKTGIYKYRLVSISINWYRFAGFVEGDTNCGKTPVGHAD